MPKGVKVGVAKARASPAVPATPVSRRLRSRAATTASTLDDTTKSSVANYSRHNVTTDFDSDSEDFAPKKRRPMPKPKKVTKTKAKKPPVTPQSETTTESDIVMCTVKRKVPAPSTSESDVNEKVTKAGRPRKVQPLINATSETLSLKIARLDYIPPAPIATAASVTNQIVPSKPPSKAALPIEIGSSTQSSSEEYKTPEAVEKRPKPLIDISNMVELPDIVQEYSVDKEHVPFITKNPQLQQIELEARKKLLEVRNNMDVMIRRFRLDSLRKTLEVSSKFGNMLVCDILDQMGRPSSFEEFVNGLQTVKITNQMKRGKLAIISEDSEMDYDSEATVEPNVFKTPPNGPTTSKSKLAFPHPNNQNLTTPPPGLHTLPNPVFNFGAGSTTDSKFSRLAKPGEIYYSQRGSPILPPVLSKAGYGVESLYAQPTKPAHTIEVIDGDGEKIKVDLVLRSGAPEKARFFAEFVTDVRGIAATRSTVKHNRIQAPRVPVKSRKGVSTSTTVSAAATKKRHC